MSELVIALAVVFAGLAVMAVAAVAMFFRLFEDFPPPPLRVVVVKRENDNRP